MMEVIVLLKLEVDSEQLKKGDDTDDHIKSKIRAYVADIVAHVVDTQEHIVLFGSSLATEIKPTGIVKIQPSSPVLRLPPDVKVE